MKKFRMKNPPIQPRKKRIENEINLIGLSLQEILDDIPYNNPTFRSEFEIYEEDDCRVTTCSLIYSYDETDEEFAARQKEYELKLQEYNLWYDNNKEQIDKILAERKKEKQKKEAKRLEREKKRKEKELQQKKKLYEKLKKEFAGSIDK